MVRDPAADGLYVTEQAANPAAVGASVHLDERNVPAPLDAMLGALPYLSVIARAL